MSITVIVKATNQEIEDQTIKCELTWTISKLKQHLSEISISKPPKDDQKLTYLGQLLSDTIVLGDLFKQCDGQGTYTVHLQSTTKDTIIKQSSSTQNNMAEVSTSTKMAWMQQAYIQYMTDLMNFNSNYMQSQRGGQVQASKKYINRNRNRNSIEIQQPVVPQLNRDPEIPDRDLLDIFVIIARLMIPMSLVYLYSSPYRFLFVVSVGFGVYLRHIGFFRNFYNNNNHNNNNVQEGEEQNRLSDNPDVLTIAWTFFITFFTSLIPEVLDEPV